MQYPNTHYGLGKLALDEDDFSQAFKYGLDALRLSINNQELFNESLHLTRKAAFEYENSRSFDSIYIELIDNLKKRSGKDIQIEEDESIENIAKLEIAEIYNRGFHLLKLKPNSIGRVAVILHELMHLVFICDARDIGENYYFGSKTKGIDSFKESLLSWQKQAVKKGIPKGSIERLMQSLFHGLNLQIYNAPIDLFIEDKIARDYPEIRPIHFNAYLNVLNQAISATTKKDIVENMPSSIISKSKTYSLVGAMHFKDIFGIDLVKFFNPSKSELTQATAFYEEFNEYRKDKEPAEEYEIIKNWGEDLGVSEYFELIPDEGTDSFTEQILDEIESDPFNLKGDKEDEDRELHLFIENQKKLGLNVAVAMFMVDAISYFSAMKKEKVKEIAFEIAMLGRAGYSPDKNGYKVPSIPGKEFSGYNILAYYYVSWAIAIPEMLSQLGLPFEKEYEMAKTLSAK